MSSKKDVAGDRHVSFPPVSSQRARPAGPENLGRLKSNLWRNAAATKYLFDRGLSAETIRKFHLGIKEPYHRRSDGKTVSGVLCYPLISSNGEPLSRYGYYSIPGVTEYPPDQDSLGPGRPATYYSGDVTTKTILLVADNCLELWILDQHLKGTEHEETTVIISPSHPSCIPDEWKTEEFWSRWAAVFFVQGNAGGNEKTIRRLARYCLRDIFRVCIPNDMGQNWIEFFRLGGTADRFIELQRTSTLLSSSAPKEDERKDQVGEFAANPVNINGAFVNGYLYYPFTVERREMEASGRGNGPKGRQLVASYVAKIVRSDGAVLDVIRLASPRGTPRERQVLALTDGTRVEKEPQPSHYASWQLVSIQRFIRDMHGGSGPSHRPLKDLLSGVIEHLRASIWLPYEDDYTLLALYIAVSFVYQIFEAVPLVMVRGDKGTGKSELGDAMAKLACNAAIVGQGSAASIVRLLNEAHGLIVLDDLESVGRALEGTTFGDISQMLKLGYKKCTARKTITGKNGKTTVFDFFGPKVINNTKGVDPILGSRMLHIHTRKMPEAVRGKFGVGGGEPEDLIQLRDEFHVWGMANAHLAYSTYLSLMKSNWDRQEEIHAPLRTIAFLSGDDLIRQSLEAALRRQSTRRRRIQEPVEMLKEAINSCILDGATRELSAAQLKLEFQIVIEQNRDSDNSQESYLWSRPEWIAQQLISLGVREPGSRVTRARLYGHITRVYKLRSAYVSDVIAAEPARTITQHGSSPFSFCEDTVCDKCPYEHVCPGTVPGLKDAKALRRGKSGRRFQGGELPPDAEQA
jgi:hypothetical protein